MTSKQLREKFLKFFESKGHKRINPAKLVLANDPTTLFTGSGMQPLIPYLLGEKHPEGNRLVDSQPSFRAEDILEVGDNRHITFFEMLGNWSLGDYFKKEQLEWFYLFLTEELSLDPQRLHVTVFEGNELVPKDEETYKIWESLGIPKERIHYYSVKENWWSRSGTPEQMPVGEIGGIDSEVFYEFIKVEHDPKFGDICHPHCDCGHFMEIGNSVFIQYKKIGDGEFETLPQKNVDFGGGLERLTAASNNNPDIFQIDLFSNLITEIEKISGKKYSDPQNKRAIRIIADHIRAAMFILGEDVEPSNKDRGYVLRRLIRRAITYLHLLNSQASSLLPVIDVSIQQYKDIYPYLKQNKEFIEAAYSNEEARFKILLKSALSKLEKEILSLDSKVFSGKLAFDLYQNHGLPVELVEELLKEKGFTLNRDKYDEEFKKHQEISRAGQQKKFAGGLAGHSEVEVKYHTTTHLLHQALRDVLGDKVFQKGSNITSERLRFDFSFNRKLTEAEIKKVEEIINQKIKTDLKVEKKVISVDEAKKMNAIGLFDEKYKEQVSVYGIGPDYELDPQAKDQRDRNGYYSLEFCGGPHVEHTGIIGEVKLVKEEAVSAGIRRIKAVIG